MGKLTDNLELLDRGYIGTYRQMPDDNSLLSDIMVLNDKIESTSIPAQKQYVVQTRFAVSQIVPSTGDGDWSKVCEHIMYTAKKTIVNAVYGEFREPLIRLMVDLRHEGMEKQFRQAESIYNEMFGRD